MTQSRDRLYTPDEKRQIVQIARRSMVAALAGRPPPTPATDAPPFLQEHRGCFVTLRSPSGRLRGCIGTFETAEPLIDVLITMAAAATRDSRFVRDPVTLEEAEDLVLSVRVLTPLEPLENPLELDVGREGIYIILDRERRRARGCFLPEVATEQGWDAAELVSHCCADKMKISRDAWRPPTDLKFFRFRAIAVSE